MTITRQVARSLAPSHRDEREAIPRCDVLLVVPPFCVQAWPALGPSLLQQGCRDRGLSAEVCYANFELVEWLGKAFYRKISEAALRKLAGERLFAPFAFTSPDESQKDWRRLVHTYSQILDELDCGPEQLAVDLRSLAGQVAGFLSTTAANILDAGPAIVGFSSVFQQTMASLALARIVKQRRPEIVTVFGGAHADAPMGAELARVASSLDYVFSGEADWAFPDFCADFVDSGGLPDQRVVLCPPVSDLDSLPHPCFDSWFSQSMRFSEAGDESVRPWFLPFESSRGCWWGERSHCTFCGLNGTGMRYRKKSPSRVLEELERARSCWDVERFHATDNILPMNGLVRCLAASTEKYDLFYEVKANLDARALDDLRAAGITSIQPGIESLSTRLLEAIKKGTTAPQNIALLRDARARGIKLSWNYLVGIPGEQASDYRQVLRILPLLEHLEPPGSCGMLQIDRYSPYFDRPTDFGIEKVRPCAGYETMFPPGTDLGRIAYHFTGEWSSGLLQEPELENELRQAIDSWQRSWNQQEGACHLRLLSGGGYSFVEDTRRCATAAIHKLTPEELRVLDRLERPRRSVPSGDAEILGRLHRRRLVVHQDDRWLSLVTQPA